MSAPSPATLPLRPGVLGMWVFLATELMLFGPLFLGYVYVRLHFPAAAAAASRQTDFWLGTANTAVLLTSSLAVAMALAAGEAGSIREAKRWLFMAAACGLLFLAIKGSEYAHEWHAHLFPGARFRFALPEAGGAEMFFFLYFALTGLHALHLTVGIGAVLAMAWLLRGDAPPAGLEPVALYWHFVDVVWIFLYPMLYLVGRGAG